MIFWREHTTLRLILMLILFVTGLGLLVSGWRMTGRLEGLLIMLAGITLLLTALLLYNKPFETPRLSKRRDTLER